jgi:hypothetical protein
LGIAHRFARGWIFLKVVFNPAASRDLKENFDDKQNKFQVIKTGFWVAVLNLFGKTSN